MKKKLITLMVASAFGASYFGCVSEANATAVSYDETLYATGAAAPEKLMAVVDMLVSGTTLSITLQNTSLAGAEDPSNLAGSMISGIAFNLPSGVLITAGDITPIGTTHSWDTSVENKQWGYANDGTGGALDHAALSYNAEASTITSDAPTRFDNSSGNSDGLNFGAVSPNISGPGGAYVIDTIKLDLTLTGDLSGLVSYIDEHDIAVIFGSATASTNRVPDGGSTILLLGAALSSLGMIGRWLKK